ncbi:hypothetical protein Desaci_2690 [Desulfosporosinus acidiphilus SJ4]|uniref:Uncharacterized protein n=1 Tax=Desulfosporosinus acidiphilus (strain DSM 22704 / JCM 16185 / SJ4) TaxID=646529 RepID=I4D748_DESAJ|nr:hypothetical protein [Desulfosporosinus acidiphilus]AFM41622.1 hypothetical protein Desaci_2690 [Desulfosporosinus acidiphilus SJ4]
MHDISFGGSPMSFFPGIMGGIFSMLLLWIVLLFIVSGVLMWLWNITITRIFNIREISYWEALRLLIISAILFGKSGLNMQL